MKGIAYLSLEERILTNISPEPTSGCWLWIGCVNEAGYGLTRVNRRNERAHRIAYETFIGPIPKGLSLDHLCRTRCCVNPRHLEPVTHKENCHRSPFTGPGIKHNWTNGRAARIQCPQGHHYDLLNTFFDKKGSRLCRQCSRDKARYFAAIRKSKKETNVA